MARGKKKKSRSKKKESKANSQGISLPCFAAQVTVFQVVSLLLNRDMEGNTTGTEDVPKFPCYYVQKQILATSRVRKRDCLATTGHHSASKPYRVQGTQR